MLERLMRPVHSLALRVASKSGFLCALYYAFFSASFRREQRGVVHGRLRRMRGAEDPISCRYTLRRNIHLVEKGLLRRPPHRVFAIDYIRETVDCYARALELGETSAGFVSEIEMRWFSDVLMRYFELVAPHPAIDEPRNRFRTLQGCVPARTPTAVPYCRDLLRLPTVKYEDLLELARRRRSVRWFLQKAVPRKIIDRALTVAALSPSACNLQPFEFRVFDDAELAKQIASIPTGTIGFSHNFPVVVVLIGKLHAWASEQDRHLIYIDASLAAMAFLFTLEVQGLGTCCINSPDQQPQERRMTDLLGLERDERVVMLIALGYPDLDGLVAYSQKKAVAELRSFNVTR
jgi:nitroreductase